MGTQSKCLYIFTPPSSDDRGTHEGRKYTRPDIHKQSRDNNTIRHIKNHNIRPQIIEVSTNLKDCNELTSNNDEATEIEETDLRQLNFHHENVSWDEIKEIIKEMPWTELFNGKNNEECTDIFIYFIRIICFWKIT